MAERSATVDVEGDVGRLVADLQVSRAWLVDPLAGREGPGEIVVADGTLEAVTWLEGAEADGIEPTGVVIAPGFIDLHAHLREPGSEDAETIASGLAAAAHGGFTTVCAMPNTDPATDEPGVLARVLAAAAASGSPVELLAYGATTVGRAGSILAPLGELADAGAIGFSDDGAPVRSASILRNALLYAGMLDRPIVEHAEDPDLTEGAEANEGLVATVLGLRGWPVAAEAGPVARGLAILADVILDEPRARLHFTHLSTGAALELVRRAKATGLPVTCDVTPHHLALSDDWLAGGRDWAWAADEPAWLGRRQPAPPYQTAVRVNPPLRDRADAAACLAALIDGTADAVATDHAPHRQVDKAVEFGLAANGISGIETAIGLLLAAVDDGRLTLRRAIEALTSGPAALLGGAGRPGRGGLVEGAPANLVVVDRSSRWLVEAGSLQSRGKNSPLIGRELPGQVLLTIAAGRIAYQAPDPA
ncbi:MAG TPA: dihydroorotase [Candidatus Limnocylindrales bacterium]|jgi:dihydroorotase